MATATVHGVSVAGTPEEIAKIIMLTGPRSAGVIPPDPSNWNVVPQFPRVWPDVTLICVV